MLEQSKEIFTKSVLFEATGQKVSVTISFENCDRTDYEKLKSVIENLCDDITATAENLFLRAD